LSTTDDLVPDAVLDADKPGSGGLEALRAGGAEMAVAGFVLSVLWLFFLGSIAGLCLGVASRRSLAAERSAEGPAPALWVTRLATTAVALGGLGATVAVVLAVLQVAGVVDIAATCHSAATGVTCRLVIH